MTSTVRISGQSSSSAIFRPWLQSDSLRNAECITTSARFRRTSATRRVESSPRTRRKTEPLQSRPVSEAVKHEHISSDHPGEIHRSIDHLRDPARQDAATELVQSSCVIPTPTSRVPNSNAVHKAPASPSQYTLSSRVWNPDPLSGHPPATEASAEVSAALSHELLTWNTLRLLAEEQHRKTTSKRRRSKKFACPKCPMMFSNRGQLTGHYRKHTGERPFSCDCCGKRFTRNEELTRHSRIHTGDRPFACDLCAKRFGRKDHLNKHRRTHASTAVAASAGLMMCHQHASVAPLPLHLMWLSGGGGGGGGCPLITHPPPC